MEKTDILDETVKIFLIQEQQKRSENVKDLVNKIDKGIAYSEISFQMG